MNDEKTIQNNDNLDLSNDLKENFLIENFQDYYKFLEEENDTNAIKQISRKKTEFLKTQKLNLYKSDDLKKKSNRIFENHYKPQIIGKLYRNKSINYKKKKNLKLNYNRVIQSPNLNIQVADELNRNDKYNEDQQNFTFSKYIFHSFINLYKHREDYKKRKIHQIRYKRIFESDQDFDKIEVEVSCLRKSKNDLRYLLSNNTDKNKNKQNQKIRKKEISKCDALLIEYCPEVFKRLRSLDEFQGEELFK